MRDVRQRLRDERRVSPHERIALGASLARHRADAQAAIGRFDAGQRIDPIQVDEHGGTREPEVQHGHQALAARERLRFVAVLREQRERLLDAFRGEVLERRRLHDRASRISSKRRPGPSGISRISRPASASAFSSACANSAPAGIAPASPAPFTPSGFNGDGVSRCTVSMRGTSSAVGSR